MTGAGTCRHCGSMLGWTWDRTVACPHCDSVCNVKGCPLCKQMNHPIRIIKRDDGEAK